MCLCVLGGDKVILCNSVDKNLFCILDSSCQDTDRKKPKHKINVSHCLSSTQTNELFLSKKWVRRTDQVSPLVGVPLFSKEKKKEHRDPLSMSRETVQITDIRLFKCFKHYNLKKNNNFTFKSEMPWCLKKKTAMLVSEFC